MEFPTTCSNWIAWSHSIGFETNVLRWDVFLFSSFDNNKNNGFFFHGDDFKCTHTTHLIHLNFEIKREKRRNIDLEMQQQQMPFTPTEFGAYLTTAESHLNAFNCTIIRNWCAHQRTSTPKKAVIEHDNSCALFCLSLSFLSLSIWRIHFLFFFFRF